MNSPRRPLFSEIRQNVIVKNVKSFVYVTTADHNLELGLFKLCQFILNHCFSSSIPSTQQLRCFNYPYTPGRPKPLHFNLVNKILLYGFHFVFLFSLTHHHSSLYMPKPDEYVKHTMYHRQQNKY